MLSSSINDDGDGANDVLCVSIFASVGKFRVFLKISKQSDNNIPIIFSWLCNQDAVIPEPPYHENPPE